MAQSEVLIVGGGGHIGLPLSLFLANKKKRVTILDISKTTINQINAKKMPFYEPGCQELLESCIHNHSLIATTSLAEFKNSSWKVVIVVIGTQLLSSGEPDREGVLKCVGNIVQYIAKNGLLVLRSTIFPGTTHSVQEYLSNLDRSDIKVIFAPERIAEGFALDELEKLPQIIGADDPEGFAMGKEFFENLGIRVIHTKCLEAEFIKLITNAYRFAHFALGNAIYLATQKVNLNYSALMKVMKDDYPRLASLPKSGYVGGPCLIKDTIQLQNYLEGVSPMTHFALETNQNLLQNTIQTVVEIASRNGFTRVGILGITFKAESDDIRESPILIVMKELSKTGFEIKYFDPYAKTDDFEFVTLDNLLTVSEIVVIGTPHDQFSNLEIIQPVINVWQ